MTQTIIKSRWAAVIIALMLCLSNVSAQENANTRQARKIFDQAYNLVFGPQGCSLKYDVNIVSLYKTSGTIWYKGKKQKFIEPRYSVWCDGKDFYRVDKKKKTVEILDPNSPNRDKYASKFKFNPDDYNYHIAAKGSDLIITLDAKKGVDGVKHAKVIIDNKTRVPKSIKVKVLFFWANIKVTDFHKGVADDNIFNFPHKQYSTYKTLDKRNE